MLDLQHYDVFGEQIKKIAIQTTSCFSNIQMMTFPINSWIHDTHMHKISSATKLILPSINTFKITQMHVKCTSNLLININKMFPPKFDIHLPRTDCVQENPNSFLQSLLRQSRGISISL
jgi:hypothetical protein